MTTTATIPIISAGYMLDTALFNQLMRDEIDARLLEDRGALYATSVQSAEIRATRDAAKRERLAVLFMEINQENIPKGVSGWDEINNAPTIGLFENMLAALDGRKPPIRADLGDTAVRRIKSNNNTDIWVAEMAIRLRFTLVTDDTDLLDVATEFGGIAIRLSEFLALPPMSA